MSVVQTEKKNTKNTRIAELEKELRIARAQEVMNEAQGKGLTVFKAEIASAKNFEEVRTYAQRFVSRINNARKVLADSEEQK